MLRVRGCGDLGSKASAKKRSSNSQLLMEKSEKSQPQRWLGDIFVGVPPRGDWHSMSNLMKHVASIELNCHYQPANVVVKGNASYSVYKNLAIKNLGSHWAKAFWGESR